MARHFGMQRIILSHDTPHQFHWVRRRTTGTGHDLWETVDIALDDDGGRFFGYCTIIIATGELPLTRHARRESR